MTDDIDTNRPARFSANPPESMSKSSLCPNEAYTTIPVFRPAKIGHTKTGMTVVAGSDAVPNGNENTLRKYSLPENRHHIPGKYMKMQKKEAQTDLKCH